MINQQLIKAIWRQFLPVCVNNFCAIEKPWLFIIKIKCMANSNPV